MNRIQFSKKENDPSQSLQVKYKSQFPIKARRIDFLINFKFQKMIFTALAFKFHNLPFNIFHNFFEI